jgi:GGDEF domain-containing protein
MLVAVLFVDLDHFKRPNDIVGHDAGDAVLREVAVRLREPTRDYDTVARLGRDEFAVLMEDLPDPDVAETVAQRPDSLIKLADEAMYETKEHGRNDDPMRVAIADVSAGC